MADRLTIIGGGITGLVSAYIAAKTGVQVTILEKSNNFGGLLNTFPVGDNYLEFYYHHHFTHDVELMWLLDELNLRDKLIFNETTMAIYKNGFIYDINSFIDLLKFKPLTLISIIRFGLTSFYLVFLAKWEKYEDIPAIDWFYRWSGQSVTNTIWKPMLDIKFGSYSNVIPLSWMIGRLKQRIKSRQNGKETLVYLDGSLKVLLDALIGKLDDLNVRLYNNVDINDMIFKDNSIKKIKYNKNKMIGGPFLFTIPTTEIVKLFRSQKSLLIKKLSKIKYFGAICVVLELNRKFSDTYWLNVADQGFPFGGIIEHTNFIPSSHYGDKNIIYLSRYFDHSDMIATKTKNEITDIMLKPLTKINSSFKKSWIEKIHIFKTNTAAVVCDLNFSHKIIHCKTPIRDLYIANMMHVYPDERSVNNSIKVAANACKCIGYNVKGFYQSNSMAGNIGFDK